MNASPTILLTGKNGQIGWELQRTIAPLGNVIALGRQEMDLADPDSIRRVIRETRPNLIINAAAYTAVDKAEEEAELAMAVNGVAPGIMAEEVRRIGAAIVHYSTDYIFNGTKNKPYTEEDEPNPFSVYGETKLAGERTIIETGASYLILRTSWVYGMRGKNFLLTILRLAREKQELSIVNDQIGAPTWSGQIAETTAKILTHRNHSPVKDFIESLLDTSGIYHLSAAGETTWYDYAKRILEYASQAGLLAESPIPKLIGIPTSDYPTPATRPMYSVLSNKKLINVFGIKPKTWDNDLKHCMSNIASWAT